MAADKAIKLTPKQRQILKQVAEGHELTSNIDTKTNQEFGAILFEPGDEALRSSHNVLPTTLRSLKSKRVIVEASRTPNTLMTGTIHIIYCLTQLGRDEA